MPGTPHSPDGTPPPVGSPIEALEEPLGLRWIMGVGGLFAILPGIALVSAAALPLAVFLAGGIALRPKLLARSLQRPPFAAVIFILFVGWALLSSVWTINADHNGALRLAGGITGGILLIVAANRDDLSRKFVHSASVAALLVGTVALILELHWDMPLNRAAAPGETLVEIARGPMRGTTILTVLIWSALAMALRIRHPAGAITFALLIVSSAYLVAISPMDASFLVFALALVAGLLAAILRGRAIVLVFAVLAAWLCLAPTLSPILFSPDQANALPLSWAHRIQIWFNASELISQQPLIGRGLDSSSAIRDEMVFRGRVLPSISQHPHSASLQIWLECGAVGAILGAATLLAAGGGLARAFGESRVASAAIAATAVAIGAYANLSFSVWQDWWMATAFVATAMIASLYRPAAIASAKSP